MEVFCPKCSGAIQVECDEVGLHLMCSCGCRFVVDQNGGTHILPPKKINLHGDSRKNSFEQPLSFEHDEKYRKNMAWRRWSARIIDIQIWRCVLTLLMFVSFKIGLRFESEELANEILSITCAFGYFVFDIVVYVLFGNTLGKKAMGLYVSHDDMTCLKVREYVIRTMWVMVSGFWIVLWPIGYLIQYFHVSNHGRATYDERLGTDVLSSRELNKGLDFAGVGLFILLGAIAKVLEKLLF